MMVEIEQGKPRLVEHAPLLAPWDFAIRGSALAWSSLWEPVPRPGWHDLFALTKRGEMRIEGNTWALFANLQYVKDLLVLPRTGEKQ